MATIPVSFGPRSAALFDTLMHIFVLSLVLHVLFVYRLRKTEINAGSEHLNKAVANITANAPILSQPTIDLFRAVSTEDQYNAKRSNELVMMRNAYLIGGFGAACVVLYVMMRYSCQKQDSYAVLNHTVGSNLALLGLVGVIEVVFIVFVVLKFRPTSPNFLSNVAQNRIATAATKAPVTNAHLPTSHKAMVYALIAIAITYLVWTANDKSFDAEKNKTIFSSMMHLNYTGIIWQACAISLAINLVFFTFGKKQEVLIMQSSTERVVDDLTAPIWRTLDVMAPTQKMTLEEDLKKLQPKPVVLPNNEAIYLRAFLITFIVFGMCGISSMFKRAYAGKDDAIDWKQMGRTAALSACCRLFAEFTFLNDVPSNYNVITTQGAKDIITRQFELKLARKYAHSSAPSSADASTPHADASTPSTPAPTTAGNSG